MLLLRFLLLVSLLVHNWCHYDTPLYGRATDIERTAAGLLLLLLLDACDNIAATNIKLVSDTSISMMRDDDFENVDVNGDQKPHQSLTTMRTRDRLYMGLCIIQNMNRRELTS